MYLEGAGGGNQHESYELAAYLYLKHVELKNTKPFSFVTGDGYWENTKAKYIQKKAKTISTQWEETLRKERILTI
jgi:hypothetical protein